MQCPACRIGLIMTEKQGVEIDYCPQCWGIWLDRGELHKLIERSYYSPAEALHRIPPPYGRSGQERDAGSFDHEKSKRKSFFAKLFD